MEQGFTAKPKNQKIIYDYVRYDMAVHCSKFLKYGALPVSVNTILKINLFSKG